MQFLDEHQGEFPAGTSALLSLDRAQPSLKWGRHRLELAPGVVVDAPTAAQALALAEVVEQVLGKALAGWPVRHAALTQELAQSSGRRLQQLTRRCAPVEIFVAADSESELALSVAEQFRGAGWAGDKWSVCVPESDLAGNQWVTRHELWHLLERKFLDDGVVKRLDAAYADAVKRGGPFARRYCTSRTELVATVAHAFAGAEDALRQQQPELHAIFVEAAGRG